MSYTIDPHLQFLGKCSESNLLVLGSALLHRDSPTNRLANHPDYLRYGSDFHKYWKTLAEEFQFCTGRFMSYTQLLAKCASLLSIPYQSNTKISDLEEQIRNADNLSQEQINLEMSGNLIDASLLSVMETFLVVKDAHMAESGYQESISEFKKTASLWDKLFG